MPQPVPAAAPDAGSDGPVIGAAHTHPRSTAWILFFPRCRRIAGGLAERALGPGRLIVRGWLLFALSTLTAPLAIHGTQMGMAQPDACDAHLLSPTWNLCIPPRVRIVVASINQPRGRR